MNHAASDLTDTDRRDDDVVSETSDGSDRSSEVHNLNTLHCDEDERVIAER